MTNDVTDHFKRQAEWQKKQKDLSWPEKIRQAELLRDAALKLKKPHPPASHVRP